MTARRTITAPSGSNAKSVNKDWLRALKLTSTIEQDSKRTLAAAFDAVARERGDAPALLSERENFTFSALSQRSLCYASWALAQGLRKGDVVALMMEGRPEYIAIWLGLTRVGIVVALINSNLAGAALAHCMNVASPRVILASPTFQETCAQALQDGKISARLVICGEALDRELAEESGLPLELASSAQPTLSDHALYIYTSGTTGLPKAAIVSHRRIMNWSLWFSGLLDITAADRMYDCLPLYHSVGGVVAVWATLLGGGSVVIRERFSARAFWDDVVFYECTLFQYIGELCRYLVHAPASDAERRHRLRLVVGNGLRPDIWAAFSGRFALPRIIEFYAATESNFSLYNVEGELGAIGRIPAFLSVRNPVRIVKYDADSDAPFRGEDGFCQLCDVNEPGETFCRISGDFDGYLDRSASEKKILRNVFEPGDAWMRSGDLMRRDARGFFYFVDRIGDTFRWKGENVATAEVAQAIAAFPGVLDVNVYGVEAPGRDGRAGMAAIVVNDAFDRDALRAHLNRSLPPYARPLFLRLSRALETTDTFKHKKRELAAQGFDPEAISEPLFFAPPDRTIYLALDSTLYQRILAGAVAL